MKRKDVPLFVRAIEDAISVLEYYAHKNNYINDSEHNRLVAYLQKAKEKNAKKANLSEEQHI